MLGTSAVRLITLSEASLALLGVGIAGAFLPALHSPAEAPRWVLLSALVPILVWMRPQTRITPGHWLCAAVLAWALFTQLWARDPVNGWGVLWHYGIFAAAALVRPSQALWFGLALGLATQLPLIVAQALGWEGLAQVAAPAGLFINKNMMGEAMTLGLIWALGQRQWWLAGALALCVGLSQERNAWLCLGLLAVVWLWQQRKRSLALALALAGALVGLAFNPSSLMSRWAFWHGAWAGRSWLGQGAGAFYSWFPLAGVPYPLFRDRPLWPHNEVVDVIFQFGLGAGLWLALALWVWQAPGPQWAKYLLAAFGLLSLFAFPLHSPVTLALAAFAFGELGSAGPGSSLRLWKCGIALLWDRARANA